MRYNFRRTHLFTTAMLFCMITALAQTASVRAETLTRDEAIQIALSSNPEVAAARQSWEIAKARLIQARAFPDPELGFEYEELSGVSNIDGYGERNVGINQRVELPVKWWLRNKVAKKRSDAVKMAVFEMTKLEVATRVKTAFDRVLLAREILEYKKQDLQLAQDLLQKSQVRFEAGDVPELEVLRAGVEAGRAENRVTIARNDQLVFGAVLNSLLGREANRPMVLNGDLSYSPLETDLERLRKLSIDLRPDLLGSELNLAAARSNKSAAMLSIVPDVNIGVYRQSIRSNFGRDDYWHVLFGIDLPIWGMFRQRGKIVQAKAETALADAERNAVRYQLLLEVESAFLDLRAAAEQVQLYRDRILQEAQRAYEVASLSYQEGKASYLELLESQRALTDTRVEYAQALFNHKSALAALERAVGGNLPE